MTEKIVIAVVWSDDNRAMSAHATPLADIAPEARRQAWIALLLLVPLPTISVLMSLYASPGPIGVAVFAIAKLWILAFPILWAMKVERITPRFALCRNGVAIALGIGVLTAAAIASGYFLIARDWIDPSVVGTLARRNGLTSPAVYAVAALMWCVVNSLLEEYVWRWFVFRRCSTLLPRQGGWGAIALSSLLFTLHHVLALSAQFDWRVTLIGSLGVFVGGVMWAWLRRRRQARRARPQAHHRLLRHPRRTRS
jgi:membrane protease YdiL (CAAX protease family)